MKRSRYWVGLDAGGDLVESYTTDEPESCPWSSEVSYLVGPWWPCSSEGCENHCGRLQEYCSPECREEYLSAIDESRDMERYLSDPRLY